MFKSGLLARAQYSNSRAGAFTRRMATIRTSLPHEQRTAAEPRDAAIESVLLTHIQPINNTIRLLRLRPVDPDHTIQFLPGQWLDVFVPGLRSAGGFTITSAPSQARPSRSTRTSGFLELAIQKSANPPAQWLWRPEDEIKNAQLAVRVGGSFTWPPPATSGIDMTRIQRLVLIAGGVGINPLMSIFSHLIRSRTRPREVHFIYATKAESDLNAQRILFLPRLMDLVAAAADHSNVSLSVFLSGVGDYNTIEHGSFPNRCFARRFDEADLCAALDGYRSSTPLNDNGRQDTLCYVCGPPKMTDEVVELVGRQPGMDPSRVLCEKWW